MFTVAEVLSLPPERALLGTIVADQTGLTERYTMARDYPFPAQVPSDPGCSSGLRTPFLVHGRPGAAGDCGSCLAKGRSRLVVVESVSKLPSAN